MFAQFRTSAAGSIKSYRPIPVLDMLKHDGAAFFEATTALASLGTALTRLMNNPENTNAKDTTVQANVRDVFLREAANLKKSILPLGATYTDMVVDRLIDALRDEDDVATVGVLAKFLQEIQSRLKDELTNSMLLALSKEDSAFFEPRSPLFGMDFVEKFPTRGAYELDEAAKCRALGRPTACVFHLMRLLEVGIEAMRLCLRIPEAIKPVERNWTFILKKMDEEGIQKNWPTAADKMCADAVLFQGLHASLDAVKNPWRNGTMHVENKYTEDEADHIFAAVKGFMKVLASRMDEKGLPLVPDRISRMPV